ncbi:hypothetical protein NQ314_013254 [Rhamnusium bicolor]|uniref:Pyruvate kinase C-terminal domain-containing protein n=1 Tax=Rhamnusium bicolor TaxID=1586634 RepID=A0AAV8X833_9CUCU|nr:hypothetical protein NQ314_013254 [Rhamnusium bicolor]
MGSMPKIIAEFLGLHDAMEFIDYYSAYFHYNFGRCGRKPGICSISISDLSSVSKSEVCDIANAIMDGSDALLLPQETCIKHLVKSISVICREAEPAIYQKQIFSELTRCVTTPTEALYSLAISAVESALKTNSAAIICLTSSGRTAKLLSRFRPRCPIIAVTRYARVARQLRLYKGIEPLIYLKSFEGNWDKDVEERVQLGVTYGKYVGYIRMGDAVVSVTGSRPESGMPNNIQVVYASEFDALPRKNKYGNTL